jgi:biopolymer transport protein ExbB
MLNFIFLQASQNLSEIPKPVGNTVHADGLMKEFFNMAINSGPIMIPILILSIMAIFIFLERYIAIYRAGRINSKLMNSLREHILNGKIDSAFSLCRMENTPISRMIEKGISRIGRSLTEVTTAIDNVGNQETSKLQRGLPILASVVGAAPMLGILGTVVGIIQAFYDMANSGKTIDLTLIISNVYQTLVTTVAGFVVGIIAYLAYNILVASVEAAIFNVKTATIEFVDMLNEQAR